MTFTANPADHNAQNTETLTGVDIADFLTGGSFDVMLGADVDSTTIISSGNAFSAITSEVRGIVTVSYTIVPAPAALGGTAGGLLVLGLRRRR